MFKIEKKIKLIIISSSENKMPQKTTNYSLKDELMRKKTTFL